MERAATQRADRAGPTPAAARHAEAAEAGALAFAMQASRRGTAQRAVLQGIQSSPVAQAQGQRLAALQFAGRIGPAAWTPGEGLAGLVGELNRAGAAERLAANTESCWTILKVDFGANWFRAKACLLMDEWPAPVVAPNHQASLKLMDGLVAMRGIKTTEVQKLTEAAIQAQVHEEAQAAKGEADPRRPADPLRGAAPQLAAEAKISNAPGPVKDGKADPGQQVEFKAPVGNQKRTSDIDVATGGMNTELAVALYNRMFKEALDVEFESGTVFDYNVYAMDWIHGSVKKHETRPGTWKNLWQERTVTTMVTPKQEHNMGDGVEKKAREGVMEKAALLKLRRYMTGAEWLNYIAARSAQVPPDQVAALQTLLFEVADQHLAFKAEIYLRRQAIADEIDVAVDAEDDFDQQALTTSASNRIYEDRLREVKALRAQHAALEAKAVKTPEDKQAADRLAKEVARALSEALYFANEVYASEGATLHTVVGLQMGGKTNKEQAATGVKVAIALTDSQRMQAFNENVGDALKDVDHYGARPAFAAYRAGKYIDRMCHAALMVSPLAEALPLFASLKALAVRAVAAKESPEGDDPVAVMKKFAEWSPIRLYGLRADLLAFGAAVAALAPRPPVAPPVARDAAPAAPQGGPPQRPPPARPGPPGGGAAALVQPLEDASRAVARVQELVTLPGEVPA